MTKLGTGRPPPSPTVVSSDDELGEARVGIPKAAGSTQSPKDAPSRTVSSVPPVPVASPPSVKQQDTAEHRDASSLFGRSGGVDLEGLACNPSKAAFSPPPQPPSAQPIPPPPPQQPPPPPPQPSALETELRTLMENQKLTIKLLVSEKTSLTAQLEGVEELERKYADGEAQLKDSREVEGGQKREKAAAERAREQELELEDARQTTNDLMSRLQESERKLRALEEDDRAVTLERNLKASQDRVTELELQIGKLKQNLTNTNHERDDLKKKMDELTENNEAVTQEKTTLQQELEELKSIHSTASSFLSGAEQARSSPQFLLEATTATVAALQHQVSQLSSDSPAMHVSSTRHDPSRRKLDVVPLRLEEIRPRVVELSNKNAEDEQRVWAAEKKVKELESEVERLEGVGQERTDALEEAEGKAKALDDDMNKMGKKHGNVFKTLGESVSDTQASHVGLAHELADSKAAVAKLEKEVAELRRRDGDVGFEVKRLNDELESRTTELLTVREQLDKSQAEEQEAAAMLRKRVSASEQASPTQPSGPNLSDELLFNLRQQHALDMSTAYYRIQEPETQVFVMHRLQPTSSNVGSALASPQSSVDRRASLSSNRPLTPPSLHRVLAPGPVYEDSLPAETHHKRKVSLSMLKARIESERTAASATLNSPRSSLSCIPISEAYEPTGGTHTPKSEHSHTKRQPNALDEAVGMHILIFGLDVFVSVKH
ncbi:hypothetical protein M422DRAFT_256254 [Sphaerobolus stellatus SS14]|uniref:Uncharacterized protein n=1 Tax=Sphaerobolus stellatus (strain SS14) TaxID=990650 RepID=A0A0C9VR72_SPHS4|nr:hypothetical protein M422DRAFT_256254 [Sphaerobolus stellatus SS14]